MGLVGLATFLASPSLSSAVRHRIDESEFKSQSASLVENITWLQCAKCLFPFKHYVRLAIKYFFYNRELEKTMKKRLKTFFSDKIVLIS